jgi:N-acetylneuraminic acid mutarotase
MKIRAASVWTATLSALVVAGLAVAPAVGSTSSPVPGRANVRVSASAAPGRWVQTGFLRVGRDGPRLVRLHDGRVLAVDGTDSNYLPAPSAELYDPQTGHWTVTGSMRTARSGSAVVVLRDGRVLVAGGTYLADPRGPRVLASAEIYDPVTGAWTTTAPLHVAREGPAAALLPDGRVLVAGGWGRREAVSLGSAEVYDPATAAWTLTGRLLVRHGPATAVSLRNGDVLIAGGYRDYGDVTAEAERYDVTTGTWHRAGHLSQPRDAALFRLPSGRVLAIGGSITGYRATTRVDVYRPRTSTWRIVRPLPARRAGIHLSSVRGFPLAIGGSNGRGVQTTVFRYRPTNGTWVSVAPLPRRLGGFGAVRLRAGTTLIAGGHPDRPDATPVRYSAIYHPG